MSTKEFTYRQRLRQMDHKNIKAWERLAARVSLYIGGLILLTAVVISILRGGGV